MTLSWMFERGSEPYVFRVAESNLRDSSIESNEPRWGGSSEIKDIIETNASQDNDTSYMLGATTAKEAHLLVTGMNLGTALKLRRDVCDMLGLDQAPATAGS